MNTMAYKGYEALVQYDEDAEILHGEVLNLKDVITFQGRSVAELKQAFADSRCAGSAARNPKNHFPDNSSFAWSRRFTGLWSVPPGGPGSASTSGWPQRWSGQRSAEYRSTRAALAPFPLGRAPAISAP